MSRQKKKVPDYTLRAIKKYNEKFDIFTDKLPAGTKERMRAVGFSAGDRCAAIMQALEEREREAAEK
jgi:hypothetical protein